MAKKPMNTVRAWPVISCIIVTCFNSVSLSSRFLGVMICNYVWIINAIALKLIANIRSNTGTYHEKTHPVTGTLCLAAQQPG